MLFQNFAEYLDITHEKLQKLSRHPANRPFEWRPDNSPKPKKGVLLIHGLLDSPYKMQDMGRLYLQEGFLVRAILLPGHGTKPSDLLTVKYQEWAALVDFGVESLHEDVEEVHLCGFSTGGTLALHHYLIHKNIASLTLIAPALKMRGLNKLTLFLAKTFSFFNIKKVWLVEDKEIDYARYTSLPLNAVSELYLLSELVLKKLQYELIHTPVLVSASVEDFTVLFKPILHFFEQRCASGHSRMVCFSPHPLTLKDPRIILENSALLEENILDLSHIAIPVSPDNPHYGRHGDFQMPVSKPKNIGASAEVFQGETHFYNLNRYLLHRITFNPKFEVLAKYLKEFLGIQGTE